MAPIRTGLDERMKVIRAELGEYFHEAKEAYEEAMVAFQKLDAEAYTEVKKLREKAREMNWDLTNDLLLVIALNQPLMKDLRIVACYQRAVDTIERLVRHARDIARSDKILDELEVDLPNVITAPIAKMYEGLRQLLEIIGDCLTQEAAIPQDEIRTIRRQIASSFDILINSFANMESKTMGGKRARIEIISIVNRIDRSAYNLVRLAGSWHHALTNEHINLDD